jgi:hypothetical protein
MRHFRGKGFARVSPRNHFAREQESVRKGVARKGEIVQNGDNRAALRAPLGDQREEILCRRSVDRAEGLVQQDDPPILNDQSRKQRALHLAAGQSVERALLEPGEVHRIERLLDAGDLAAADPPKQTAAHGRASRDEVQQADGKIAVDLEELREIGDIAHVQAAVINMAAEWSQQSGEAL